MGRKRDRCLHAARSCGSRGVGYLLKDRVVDTAEFLDAVRRAAGGGSVIDPEVVSGLLERRRADDRFEGLTEPELEVLGLMGSGTVERRHR
jgi:DNA-binding NarL/FixJ family response regulator